jgi:hypothetical protein
MRCVNNTEYRLTSEKKPVTNVSRRLRVRLWKRVERDRLALGARLLGTRLDPLITGRKVAIGIRRAAGVVVMARHGEQLSGVRD